VAITVLKKGQESQFKRLRAAVAGGRVERMDPGTLGAIQGLPLRYRCVCVRVAVCVVGCGAGWADGLCMDAAEAQQGSSAA
jgi:hypothetical protein